MSVQTDDAFIYFYRPDITEAEIEEVVHSLRSGWLTTGPKARTLEAEFADFLGGDVEAVAVNSATAGLHLALEAVGVGAGDEVITTTHTFTATAEAICYLGATPVFVDIDPETVCIDPACVEAAITPRTRAIVPVHFGGLGCDMEALSRFAKRNGLAVVEDAAHAFPTKLDGRLVGALDSEASVFSFYANKTLAAGEGGMLVTRNPEIARRARLMRLHGIDRDAFNRFSATKPSWRYDILAVGYKYNLPDVAAALALVQLRRAWELLEKRRAVAERYDRAFADLPLVRPPQPEANGLHSWHLYNVRLATEAAVDRDRFIELMSEAGIGCSVHYIPLHRHTYWSDKYSLTPEMFPHSDSVFRSCVSLPLYSSMTDSQVERVIVTVRKLLLKA
ncbi:DegT/DnrJ/EryC1/StrS family aminotransferase [Rhodovibrio salinarum]|uniref:DegT/DnrJ/EryC1/StrS family aminotransferase n=1 Tax=Rhodovibrio salinarum TaxID=1087 RepID=A0A934UZ34_9PROT|nr:DegT/DnrJ/EryC1/StrS family aminotransferase [Rhodovibrio salinarum]MBK1696672.1 DegT/DnrJ/EryC1/StrS family aminotransferase [Rhodovibrio salinarum]